MSVKARSIRKIKGGVTIRDYRGTGLCPPNGGVIRPLVYVHHIPVIKNRKGVGDIITLGQVLRAQGLAVQHATDAEGNVALFNYSNRLCYHARGANSVSCGSEHMHYLTSEGWTDRQMRAAAWLGWMVWKSHGIKPHRGILIDGPGNTIRVKRRGHTSHENVSKKANYYDRSDPGPRFSYTELYDLIRFFDRKHRF